MTIRAVADTHAVIWYIFDDGRLSSTARWEMDTAAASGEQIAVSSISLIEMVYLVDKGRIAPAVFDGVLQALDDPNPLLVEVFCDRSIAQAIRLVDRAQVPDLPDRIIAATAAHLGVPLISRDGKIRSSSVTTIW
ncbi:MAG TPA: type II toxin-antitoxin system VapC family toxin [Roseiflexaceae bacterium]|nr:type II toxin-antitoxin system VapC family toxin [Roseiflexaceae bacterium]